MPVSDAGRTPLVSIVLPTFNRAKLLKRAVDSVLSQTFSNWELIVWDDGSSDDTEAAVSSFPDRRIKYRRDVNHGVSHATNRAVGISTGDYVAFLDDDDEWVAEKLEHQVTIMENAPDIDILFSDFSNLNLATKERVGGFAHCREGLAMLEVEEIEPAVFRVIRGIAQGVLRSNFIAFDTAVVRRRALRSIGGFDETLRNSQDLDFWWRAALAGMRFAYTTERLMVRSKYESSLSSSCVVTALNRLKCLDVCSANAVQHVDLLPHIHAAYLRTWQGLARQYSLDHDKGSAMHAILRSLKHGFNEATLYEAWLALAGERAGRLLRSWRRRQERNSRLPE